MLKFYFFQFLSIRTAFHYFYNSKLFLIVLFYLFMGKVVQWYVNPYIYFTCQENVVVSTFQNPNASNLFESFSRVNLEAKIRQFIDDCRICFWTVLPFFSKNTQFFSTIVSTFLPKCKILRTCFKKVVFISKTYVCTF